MKCVELLLLCAALSSFGCASQPRVIVVKEKDYQAAKRAETQQQLKTDSTYQKLMEGVRNPK
jgi:hypothetical protein